MPRSCMAKWSCREETPACSASQCAKNAALYAGHAEVSVQTEKQDLCVRKEVIWSDGLRANGISQYPLYSETQAGLSVLCRSIGGQNTNSQCAVALQVKGEIIYQARRLDSHPALAIWGGGNEVEASFRWFPDSRDNPQFYTGDYMQVSKAHTYSARAAQLLSRHPHHQSIWRITSCNSIASRHCHSRYT